MRQNSTPQMETTQNHPHMTHLNSICTGIGKESPEQEGVYTNNSLTDKKTICTCFKKPTYVNKKTGLVKEACSKSWKCPAGKQWRIRYWLNRIKHVQFQQLLTITTSIPYSSAFNIHRATSLRRRYLCALRHKYPNLKYIWAMGVTSSKRIHFHILCAGQELNKRWCKNKWHRITGFIHVDLRRAKNSHPYYLLTNAASLPDIYADNTFGLKDVFALRNFRRVGVSEALRPRSMKKDHQTDYEYIGLTYDDRYANLF